MKNDHQEQPWQQLAEQYAEHYGAELRAELMELNGRAELPDTSLLDQKLKRRLQRRRQRWLRPVALAAACLLLVFLLPQLQEHWPGPTKPGAPQATDRPPSQTSSYDPATDLPAELLTPPTEQEPLPLTVDLPAEFQLTDWLQDQDKTIYYLQHEYADDVVLTLTKTTEEADYQYFEQLTLAGVQVYLQSQEDYQWLGFEVDGLRYELSCQYDINTLLQLGQAILEQ